MKIKWLGHSSFLITSDSGARILTDPYESGAYNGDLAYGPVREPAEVVTVSHLHADHFDPKGVPHGATLIKSPGTHDVRGIFVEGITTCHDETGGRQRGLNTAFCLTVNDLRVCHLGDLGHELSAKDQKALGRVDVILIPVGGYYTIDADQATRIAEALHPRVVIPMHYFTDRTRVESFPIAGVEGFLKGKKSVRRLDRSEVELSKAALPPETEVWVLRHAN